ncbi:hypothetical protein [Streptomyces sp. NPDC021224]|uniref:hypothetical protein n=1 Tax=unclassified Streptomyces TaxID=2593676 RepID=UPI00379C85F2
MPTPPPPPPPAGDPAPPQGPRPRPYGSVRLAAPVAAVAPPVTGPRAAAAGHWPYGSVRLPLLSIAALRAGRRRSG